jgi:hypothetical protein
MAKRSGSEIRRRTKPRNVRFTPEEDAAISAMAKASGYSFAELVRHALFDAPAPKAIHRRLADEQAIARVLAELARLKAEAGKHGSNLNQIAHHLNAGRPVARLENLLEDALDAVTTFYERDMAELRLAVLQAVGLELHYDEPQAREAGKDAPPPSA